MINHNKDVNDETGEVVELHTHIYIEYETPSKVSTVANLFGGAPNFIEVVQKKKEMLRYLTHKDQKQKSNTIMIMKSILTRILIIKLR